MLLPFFEWCENSWVGDSIRSSAWLFPAIEAVHLLGLALIAAAVLLVDMRLLGLGLRRQPVVELARDAQPWFIASLFVMLPTGFLLFMSEAIKCYYHLAFWVKMSCLLAAIVFTFTVRRKVAMADEASLNPVWHKVVALISISLWSGVGWGGRWIGFS